jgi:hypothetical protein
MVLLEPDLTKVFRFVMFERLDSWAPEDEDDRTRLTTKLNLEVIGNARPLLFSFTPAVYANLFR